MITRVTFDQRQKNKDKTNSQLYAPAHPKFIQICATDFSFLKESLTARTIWRMYKISPGACGDFLSFSKKKVGGRQ